MPKEIGGYFSLELSQGEEYHKNAIHLNSGRAALQYILKTKGYQKIYLPTYICDSVLTPLHAESVRYEYYPINANFEPVFDKDIGNDEAFLYVNYFGINDQNVKDVIAHYQNVIIDNTQAFYAPPEPGVDTFYSARKFFGVADGAYLYTDIELNTPLEADVSYERMAHLLIRHDLSASAGYATFRKNDENIDTSGLKTMSRLTQAILSSVDYKKCEQIRRRNYLYLHTSLQDVNQLELPDLETQTPMIYPFWAENGFHLKKKLIEEKIYVATYWPEVKLRTNAPSLEFSLVDDQIPLPIDQRYTSSDMQRIVAVIENWLAQRGYKPRNQLLPDKHNY
ncbi:MAG: hypothetical protein ACOYCB_12930 [Fastidiosipilaceae bacterium]|jgi:hypothetical protein